MVGADEHTLSEQAQELRCWRIEGGAPITFWVDFDGLGEDVIDPDTQPLAALFSELEMADDDDLVTIVDEDGERAFIRTAHIAVCSIPLA